jgi:hypothetical protein
MGRSWRITHALRSKVCGTPESICGADVVPEPFMLQTSAVKVGTFRRLCGERRGYRLPCADCADKLSLKVAERTYGY